MSWTSDIKEWSSEHGKNPQTVENICVRKGWDPEKYVPSMRDQLFFWLDQWYTLSVKKLPEPATALRKNPFRLNPDEEIRKLERRAKLGDPEALIKLQRIKKRFCSHNRVEEFTKESGYYEDTYCDHYEKCLDCGRVEPTYGHPGWDPC